MLFDPENAEPGTARNLAFFKNAELHGILSWAQESTDRAERERFYSKAQDLIAQRGAVGAAGARRGGGGGARAT